MDNELPKCRKSSIDIDEPNRPIPRVDSALEQRAKDRKDSELPK
jgi:hypothetical protein